MPKYVLVTYVNGAPHVVTRWVMSEVDVAPVELVRSRVADPVVFDDRWRAKRFLRKRNEWRSYQVIQRDRL